ncbi:MAG: hypothetical protein KBC67_00140 [Candidatus Pacebacteria bacterium]|nr:hypothetical protein [Candidatus Paceibacterota bacterium]
MKKAFHFALVAVGALLLVIGFRFSVAKAGTIKSFCPVDCSVYVADDGSVFLTPRAEDGRNAEKANLNGVMYVRQDMEADDSARFVKKLCADSCMIYKIDGEEAVAAYKSSIQ